MDLRAMIKENKKHNKWAFLFYGMPGAILFILDKHYFHFFA